MADLLTLEEYKGYMNVDPTDTRNDTSIELLLTAASRTVRSFTDRNFEIAGAPSTREFVYDDSGFLDIDDCTNITLVSTDSGYPGQSYDLDTLEWTAMPHREQVTDDPYYYIVFHGRTPRPASPEMGFKRNLDRYDYVFKSPIISVTATWGWSAVPADVKLATAWIAADSFQSPLGGPVSESIEGYSRSWGTWGRDLAVPNRARDILANYMRAYG